MNRLKIGLLLFAALSLPLASQTIYVATNGSDLSNGLTPAEAVRSIFLGINKAVQNGFLQIYVSQGLYTSGAGLHTPVIGCGFFVTNDNLRIMGGWNLAFTAQSGVTELEGTSGLTNVIFVTNANNVFINNFTIRRGNAQTAGLLTGCGGGMFLWNVNNSSFSSLIFSNNTANKGGGVFLTNSHGNNFSITVQSNASVSTGAGVHLSFSHSNRFNGTIVSNQGSSGGGMWALSSFANTINADFHYNRGFSGAGLYLSASDSNRVNGNFLGNVGTGDAGAAYIFSSSNHFTGVMNGNSASVNGGAVYLAAGVNNILAGRMSSNTCGTGSGGAVTITAGAPYTTVSGEMFNNASTGGSGGAIYLASAYNLISGNMMSNSSSSVGGAIHAQSTSGSNTISGNLIRNSSGGNGGAIYLQSSSNVVSGDMVSNTSPANGGGLYMNGSSNIITGNYSYNYAASGGGIRMHAAHFNLVDVNLFGNASAGDGGGMVMFNSSFNQISGIVSRNTNGNYGGGLAMSGSHSNTIHSSFYSNTSGTFGGGVYFNSCHSNTFTGGYLSNTCRNGSGGGMAINGNSNVISANFIQNSANLGGGGLFLSGANGSIFNGSVAANYSPTSGGGFAIWNSHYNQFTGLVMSNGTFSNGAGFNFGASHSNLISGSIFSNTSGQDGAGVYMSGGTSNTVSALIQNNWGRYGAAYFDYAGNFNSFCGTAFNNSAAQGAVYLSNTAGFKLTNALISNNFATATIDTAVLLQNNAGGLTALVVSNTVFSGSGAANSFAILELGNNVTGHTLVGNIFWTNSLARLYSNFNGAVVSNHEIGVLNTPASTRHDATPAYANSTAPIPPPSVSGFFGPNSWVTNVPAVFTSSSSPGGYVITNYLWRFGDGTSSNGSNVSVTKIYNNAVTNFVSLTIFDNGGYSNTVSNAIQIYLFQLVSGTVGGSTSNGVAMTLASAVTQMNATSDTGGFFNFVASNDTYSLVPYKLGFTFSPASRSVTVLNAHTSNHNFTASDIYPVLVLKSNDSQNLQPGQKIVRDLPLYAVSLHADMLTTVSYTVSNITTNNFVTPAYFTNITGIAHGTKAVLDTTRIEDGYYLLTATAVDKVFSRTHAASMVLYFDNQLFKILDKGLEEKKAMVYDTVRNLNQSESVEFFFYLTKDQPLRLDLYDKTGRFLKNFTTANFFYGHNRLVWNKSEMPADLPAGIYYAHFKTTATDEINKSVLLVLKRN